MHGPVLVIGPGAIGTLVAARLSAAGSRVIVACRTAAAADVIRRDGLTAVSQGGEVTSAHPDVLTRPRDLTALGEKPGLCVVATKCADAPAALSTWLPSLTPDAPVVACQNGVLGDVLAPLAGGRLMECTVGLPATLAGPGRSEQTGPGRLYFGPWPQASPRDDPGRYRDVARRLAAVAPVRASGNMRGVKWTKLLINSCITSLGAATGEPLGRLLGDRRARTAFLAIVTEGHRAGLATGVRFEPVEGFRPALFDRTRLLPGNTARHAVLRLLGHRYRRQRSSSLQSLERGVKTEVDYLNGHIVATARKCGLQAPVNARLVNLVHDIEAHRASPTLANLDLLA